MNGMKMVNGKMVFILTFKEKVEAAATSHWMDVQSVRKSFNVAPVVTPQTMKQNLAWTNRYVRSMPAQKLSNSEIEDMGGGFYADGQFHKFN